MIIQVGAGHAGEFGLRSMNRGHNALPRVKLVSMAFIKNQVFTVSKDVLFQEVGGETVLLDLASERYFGLDEVGTRIWALITEGSSVGEVVDTLLEEYEVEPLKLEGDIEELLSALLEAGLISTGNAEPQFDAE